MMGEALNPRDMIEQGARDPQTDAPGFDPEPATRVETDEIELSIAISLKRIADVAEQLAACVTDQREGRSPAIRTAARQS